MQGDLLGSLQGRGGTVHGVRLHCGELEDPVAAQPEEMQAVEQEGVKDAGPVHVEDQDACW